MARACHLTALATCAGLRGSAVLLGFDAVGLQCNTFSRLFSPPWRSFLLNIVHLSVSLIKFLKISKDVICVKGVLKEADLTLP